MTLIYLVLLFLLLIFKKKRKFPKYLVFYALFVLYTVIGDLFINNKMSDPNMITSILGLPKIIAYIITNNKITSLLLLIIIENTVISDKAIANWIKILKYVVFISFIVIIIQIFIPDFFLSPREYDLAIYRFGDERRFSIFSWINTNESGHSFPALISILLSIAYMNKDKIKVNIFSVIGILYSFLTKARYVMLSVLIVLFQYFSYNKVKLITVIKYVLIIIFAFSIAFISLKTLQVPVEELIVDRILETDRGEFENTTAYTRVYAFTLFKTFFPEKPIFGTGGSMDYDLMKMKGHRTSQIHVGWLSLLYYYGIVGGLFYILFAYFLVKRLFLIAKNTNYWGSFYVFMTYFISIMGTGVSFELNYMGFIFAIIFNKYYGDKINILR
jgi:hypothetical protein